MSIPRRPYLLRAMYDWLLDSHLTPHIIVDAGYSGTRVPTQFVRDNQIILNIAPNAVGNFSLTNDEIRFNARFGGVPHQVVAPMAAIIAIYAREDGSGMMFESEPAYEQEQAELATAEQNNEQSDKPAKNRPVFRVVK